MTLDYKIEFEKLLEVLESLLAPDGCEWDRKQTHESLIPYLLEETYEIIESIEKTGYQFIGFNLNHPILKHLEVRRAISYCTPRELMLKNMFNQNLQF